jgi:hypothetical protein
LNRTAIRAFLQGKASKKRYTMPGVPTEGKIMQIAKQEVEALLKTLPDDCSMEDIQYHLYVIEKVKNGLARARTEGTFSQAEAEQRLSKWIAR